MKAPFGPPAWRSRLTSPVSAAPRSTGGETAASSAAAVRYRVTLVGIVQGVGFRPHAKRVADRRSLAGWVANRGGSLHLEIEGPAAGCDGFLRELKDRAPCAARIEEFHSRPIPPLAGVRGFNIIESGEDAAHRFIPVDIGLCDNCRLELVDARDRRHRHPFINCCDCGPRYTIIHKLPYGRDRTSMRPFHLCADCGFEFQSVDDRRFHAEPNACPECGPRYIYSDVDRIASGDAAVARAAEALALGGIVAVKGIGGFHLVCVAANEEAVGRIRRLKPRPDKPLAVMVSDLNQAREVAEVTAAEASLLQDADRPIVLVRSKKRGVAPGVSRGLETVGLILPYAPIHVLLLDELKAPLVMTSANRSDAPIVTDNEEAGSELRGIADAFLNHDRRIINGCDDSVSRSVAGRRVLLRSGRGQAPRAVRLPGKYPPILACGGDIKSSLCLAADGWAHVSQYLGDLAGPDCLDGWRRTAGRLAKLLSIEPQVVVCDAHPDYISGAAALEFGLPVRKVGHHHAHIAAVLAEKGLFEPVIGVAFDGSGWGGDGTLWGGEWLVGDRTRMSRRAHFKTARMPGGEAAVRRPWRMAVSYLREVGLDHRAIAGLLPSVDADEIAVVVRQLETGLNSPPTTSCGRLFDAAAALILGIREQTYEGQAPSYLESAASRMAEEGMYRFELDLADGNVEVDYGPMFIALIADLQNGAAADTAAARFHNGVAQAVLEVNMALRSLYGLDLVVVAGGVFANAYLLERILRNHGEAGLSVAFNENVPLNDGGISLGQAAVFAAGGGEAVCV